MDDDDFGDDDTFDTLPDGTLLQLEQSALSSTQRSASHRQPPRIQTYTSVGLSKSNNASRNGWSGPQPHIPVRAPRPVPVPVPVPVPAPSSSDYGFEEEDVIDLDEPSMVIQSASALPIRGRSESYSRPGPRYSAKALPDPETEAAFAAADAELGALQSAQRAGAPHLQPTAPAGPTVDVSALQARIAQLEASNAQLQQTELAARRAAQQKAGEIAIVRANQDRASKEYERKITEMHKSHAEESAKQKAELDLGKKEREKMETSNRFLQHDLAQEAERAKGLRDTGKARVAAVSNGAGSSTPKKDRRAGRAGILGDGFDEGEVARLVSPSKSRGKVGDQTPKIGSKRKRPAQDSPIPVPALSLSGPVQLNKTESAASEATGFARQPSIVEDDRYNFIQKLLHHRPYEGAERSMETLTRFTLPSSSSQTMSSLILDGLSTSNITSLAEPLPLKASRVILQLWDQCLQQHLYTPIYLLLDLLDFALALEPAATLTKLTTKAVQVCVRSIDRIASSTAQASRHPKFAASEEYKEIQNGPAKHVDPDDVLNLLQRICNAAALRAEDREEFWRMMEYIFTLTMLHKAQPLSQITATLRMLSTSASETTFGPIVATQSLDTQDDAAERAQKQAKQEKDMLDRLSSLLLEPPDEPKDEPPYTDEEIQELRIEILAVLKALASTDHGTTLLAQHWATIGRLVKFLEAQVNRLYSTSPSLGLENLHISSSSPSSKDNFEKQLISTPLNRPRVHDLLTQSINTTVLLLYHLLQPGTIDLQRKLRVVRGGWHKFLISFTRVAFSDQLVLEAGIESEVMDAAHMILDDVLSPEEGEAIMRAVETPRGSGSRGVWIGENEGGPGRGDEDDDTMQDIEHRDGDG